MSAESPNRNERKNRSGDHCRMRFVSISAAAIASTCNVDAKIERAMKDFDYESTDYRLDTTPGRIFYFHHDCERFWKYVRPVKKI